MSIVIPPEDEYICVADVPKQLNKTLRATWELIKRLGVPLLDGDRSMSHARFLRRDWDTPRLVGAKPAEPRATYVPAPSLEASRTKVITKPAIDWVAKARELKR